MVGTKNSSIGLTENKLKKMKKESIISILLLGIKDQRVISEKLGTAQANISKMSRQLLEKNDKVQELQEMCEELQEYSKLPPYQKATQFMLAAGVKKFSMDMEKEDPKFLTVEFKEAAGLADKGQMSKIEHDGSDGEGPKELDEEEVLFHSS